VGADKYALPRLYNFASTIGRACTVRCPLVMNALSNALSARFMACISDTSISHFPRMCCDASLLSLTSGRASENHGSPNARQAVDFIVPCNPSSTGMWSTLQPGKKMRATMLMRNIRPTAAVYALRFRPEIKRKEVVDSGLPVPLHAPQIFPHRMPPALLGAQVDCLVSDVFAESNNAGLLHAVLQMPTSTSEMGARRGNFALVGCRAVPSALEFCCISSKATAFGTRWRRGDERVCVRREGACHPVRANTPSAKRSIYRADLVFCLTPYCAQSFWEPQRGRVNTAEFISRVLKPESLI